MLFCKLSRNFSVANTTAIITIPMLYSKKKIERNSKSRIRNKVKTEPDFNLQAYLTMLLYYKTDMADLKLCEEEDKLLYKMKNPDEEMHGVVDQLIKSLSKSASKSPKEGEDTTSTTEDADGTPDS